MQEYINSFGNYAEAFRSPDELSPAELEKRGWDAFVWLCCTFDIQVGRDYDRSFGDEDYHIYGLQGADATIAEFNKGTIILAQEFAKYPPEYIKSINLNRVMLVKTIEDINAGDSSEGVMTTDGVMYLAAGVTTKELRQTIHHELEHGAQMAQRAEQSMLNRDSTGRRKPYLKIHEEWHHLHQLHDISYTEDWEKLRRPEGYATEYGAYSRDEDCATIMQYLMTNPKGFALKCAADPVLSEKADLLKQDLYWRSNGAIDEAYFTNLAQICAIQRS